MVSVDMEIIYLKMYNIAFFNGYSFTFCKYLIFVLVCSHLKKHSFSVAFDCDDPLQKYQLRQTLQLFNQVLDEHVPHRMYSIP